MDFDDLDDAIEQRLAEGDTTGLEDFMKTKKDLKEFDATKSLPPLPRGKALPAPSWETNDPDKKISLRVFVFYGPGDKADDLHAVLAGFPKYVETGVYEWPGHGERREEAPAPDLEALAQDALEAIAPALDQVCEGAEFEGAPFAFIGRSVGCQIITVLSKAILVKYGMVPCGVIMADRAPPHIPLLSAEGQDLLKTDPDKVVKAFNYEQFEMIDRNMWSNDLQYASDTRDPFFHKFDCNVMVLKGKQDVKVDELGKAQSKYKTSTLRIKGSTETFIMPVLPQTKVGALTDTIASVFAYRQSVKVSALASDGKALEGNATVPDTVLIEGLVDFQHPRYTWPHPTCIIGTGFCGTKMAMMYMVHKNENLVMIDRHDQAGGDAWLGAATKHSRVQTDFGAFNVWFGQEYTWTGDAGYGAAPGVGGREQFIKSFKGPGAPPEGSGAGTGVDYNPVRAQVIGSIQYARKEYKMEELTKYETDIVGLKIVGDPEADDRYYELTTKKLGPTGTEGTCKVSVIYHFAGAYDINRIIDYPGEDTFGGQIGYGMGHKDQGCTVFVWDDGRMQGSRAAILGNGAFAVENVRSCAENGAHKVYVVTRRKSLLCPRLPCWFCHQGPAPTPAGFLLEMFEPMYKCGGENVGDPWEYYAVNANATRTDVTIRQSSRFGIGDVSFVCAAYGILEYKIDTLAKCSPKTLHLTSGEKLEDMHHICKALGLLGDPRVDKLHNMTHRLGNMVNGDWRRVIFADATGMDAKRFTTFSAGPGASGMTQQWYYIHNHPWEMREAIKQGMMKLMPVHKISNTQPDQPVYMTNVQYEMAAGVMMSSFLPLSMRPAGEEAPFKYCLVHSMHPIDKYFEYCEADWNRYVEMFKKHNGCAGKPDVKYPYTKEQVKSWFEKYTQQLGIPIVPEGPTEAFKKGLVERSRKHDLSLQLEMIPQLVRECKLFPSSKDGDDPFASISASYIYQGKKGITASDPNSALDYDESTYEAWKQAVAMEYTCDIQVIDCKSKELLTNETTWAKSIPFLLGQKGVIDPSTVDA
mmetsp:Transcript_38218/g.100991  ORF Transcript_38218/g.100991 Transcript_38218/m.100991 type:complete len:1035 (-) Transcript_38218:370-3474(-)|eukprot:CAMPEP_0115187488 /NCGR_PEP_ID=MMETSP0270-20121206/10518_1 /TAXON_ID=71861 /ORGANISM="Scrippsiella trochoidea, Strain CCMP3099" /LENGTH=1034 /DNA_ID=CAMNT_0002600635 /DNA_START=87 /DNA_END=3191 /DNA_ORIENTATION=+